MQVLFITFLSPCIEEWYVLFGKLMGHNSILALFFPIAYIALIHFTLRMVQKTMPSEPGDVSIDMFLIESSMSSFVSRNALSVSVLGLYASCIWSLDIEEGLVILFYNWYFRFKLGRFFCI